jgi:hypothetical protein
MTIKEFLGDASPSESLETNESASASDRLVSYLSRYKYLVIQELMEMHQKTVDDRELMLTKRGKQRKRKPTRPETKETKEAAQIFKVLDANPYWAYHWKHLQDLQVKHSAYYVHTP